MTENEAQILIAHDLDELIYLSEGVTVEATRLWLEHRDTDIHTGDNYVSGCPTCESDETFILDRFVAVKIVLQQTRDRHAIASIRQALAHVDGRPIPQIEGYE